MEHDWGERTPELIAMWSRVKGENANTQTYIIIGVVLVALIAAAVARKSKKKSKHSRRRK